MTRGPVAVAETFGIVGEVMTEVGILADPHRLGRLELVPVG